MNKQYEVVVEAMLHLKIDAKDKVEARNKVLETFEKLKSSMTIDVTSLNIVERKK